ncbi:MAG: crotonase/enoyl-CoA hydratase family protein [Burkholderiaceae bacterium]|nr:crotonase/enoyl-CoA hydratase family protein [Burkholderiaceae bacterium]
MSYQCFDLEIENRVAHIRLNRPQQRNAMIREFWDELPRLVRDIDENARARVIVISSTGPHFTSGIDVGMFAETPPPDAEAARRHRIQYGADFYAVVQRMQDSFTALERSRIPVIAAIQGGCIGGGVDLATACCMRYATADAFFTIFETNIGMTADVGTFPRIVKLLPEGIVRELAYTGRRMGADEARAVGLVNAVYPDQATMLDAVMKTAREIASKSPMAVYGCKRMITYARDHDTADGLDYIGIWNASFLQREEIAEAMRSRAENRAAEFVDLPPMRRTIGKS